MKFGSSVAQLVAATEFELIDENGATIGTLGVSPVTGTPGLLMHHLDDPDVEDSALVWTVGDLGPFGEHITQVVGPRAAGSAAYAAPFTQWRGRVSDGRARVYTGAIGNSGFTESTLNTQVLADNPTTRLRAAQFTPGNVAEITAATSSGGVDTATATSSATTGSETAQLVVSADDSSTRAHARFSFVTTDSGDCGVYIGGRGSAFGGRLAIEQADAPATPVGRTWSLDVAAPTSDRLVVLSDPGGASQETVLDLRSQFDPSSPRRARVNSGWRLDDTTGRAFPRTVNAPASRPLYDALTHTGTTDASGYRTVPFSAAFTTLIAVHGQVFQSMAASNYLAQLDSVGTNTSQARFRILNLATGAFLGAGVSVPIHVIAFGN